MNIELDFPFDSRPRFGHGLPAHPDLLALVEQRRPVYEAHLKQAISCRPELLRIPRDSTYWLNDQFAGLDALCLYSFIASRRPARIVEIGSGHSTLFARRAIDDYALPSRLTSIDPHPRASIDDLCHHVVRRRLEDCDLSLFGEIQAGDIVFFDGSHRSFMNSDATVFFLEVLPHLAKGILVQIHDIYLPFDYPAEIANRYYSEQYLLACYLLGGGRGVQIEMPNAYISQDRELHGLTQPIWQCGEMQGVTPYGVSFWVTT